MQFTTVFNGPSIAAGLFHRIERALHFLQLNHAKARRVVISRGITTDFDTPAKIGKQTVASLVPDNGVVVEIGCHRGKDSEQFGLLFPRGKIYCFEPDPELFVSAAVRTVGLHNVELFPFGLSNRNEMRVFFRSSGASDASSSILEPTLHLTNHPGVEFNKSDQKVISTVTLDEVIGQLRIDRINLMWLDVQGAEGLVVEGGMKALSLTNWLYTEVSRVPGYLGGISYERLKEMLAPLGLHPVKEFIPEGAMGEGNVLFGRKHDQAFPNAHVRSDA